MSNNKICPLLSMNSSSLIKCLKNECAFYATNYCSIYELTDKIEELKTAIELL